MVAAAERRFGTPGRIPDDEYGRPGSRPPPATRSPLVDRNVRVGQLQQRQRHRGPVHRTDAIAFPAAVGLLARQQPPRELLVVVGPLGTAALPQHLTPVVVRVEVVLALCRHADRTIAELHGAFGELLVVVDTGAVEHGNARGGDRRTARAGLAEPIADAAIGVPAAAQVFDGAVDRALADDDAGHAARAQCLHL